MNVPFAPTSNFQEIWVDRLTTAQRLTLSLVFALGLVLATPGFEFVGEARAESDQSDFRISASDGTSCWPLLISRSKRRAPRTISLAGAFHTPRWMSLRA